MLQIDFYLVYLSVLWWHYFASDKYYNIFYFQNKYYKMKSKDIEFSFLIFRAGWLYKCQVYWSSRWQVMEMVEIGSGAPTY